MNILLIAGGAFLAYKALNLGQTALTADSLNIKPSAVKYTGFKNGAITFDLFFKIVNPTRKDLKVNFVFADISFIDGTALTSVNLPNYDKTLSKENETEIKVPVKIRLVDILLNTGPVWSEIKKGNLPDTLRAKGNIKVNNINVPFDEKIKVL